MKRRFDGKGFQIFLMVLTTVFLTSLTAAEFNLQDSEMIEHSIQTDEDEVYTGEQFELIVDVSLDMEEEQTYRYSTALRDSEREEYYLKNSGDHVEDQKTFEIQSDLEEVNETIEVDGEMGIRTDIIFENGDYEREFTTFNVTDEAEEEENGFLQGLQNWISNLLN